MDSSDSVSGSVTVDLPAVPGPGPSRPGQYVTPGSRYYATGGLDPNHCWVGVDGFLQIQIPDSQSDWGPVYEVSMWHTGDWIIYHFKTGKATIKKIDLCLRNPPNPTVGTPVEVYVKKSGLKVAPQHDRRPSKRLWTLAGTVVIDQPDWKVYRVDVPTVPSPPPTPDEHLVAVYLKDGEKGPESGKDRNVFVSWVKIYT